MKNTTLFALCISMLIIFTACKKEVSDTESFKFPFKVGNQWTYKRTQEIKNVIATDANKTVHDTTIIKEVHIILNEYIHEDTGEKSIQLASTVENWTHFSYYLNSNGVLYSIYGHGAGLDYTDLFPHDLDKFFCNTVFRPKILLKSATAQSDYKEAVLKFPMEVNSKWVCDPFKNITKEVTGFEKVNFNSVGYDSYKIEYTYLKDSTAKTVDYISKIGLMKRDVIIKQVNIDGKGYGDYHETWELMDYKLK